MGPIGDFDIIELVDLLMGVSLLLLLFIRCTVSIGDFDLIDRVDLH